MQRTEHALACPSRKKSKDIGLGPETLKKVEAQPPTPKGLAQWNLADDPFAVVFVVPDTIS